MGRLSIIEWWVVVVKASFNLMRAKGAVYQAGVWAPLIVAGSLVKEQGRDVEAMINIADVFQLFGELAGIDVHDVVPSSRQLDSVSLLPYLESPAQQPIRGINSTQPDANIEPIAYEVPPCVLPLGSESRRNERVFIGVNPEPDPPYSNRPADPSGKLHRASCAPD